MFRVYVAFCFLVFVSTSAKRLVSEMTCLCVKCDVKPYTPTHSLSVIGKYLVAVMLLMPCIQSQQVCKVSLWNASAAGSESYEYGRTSAIRYLGSDSSASVMSLTQDLVQNTAPSQAAGWSQQRTSFNCPQVVYSFDVKLDDFLVLNVKSPTDQTLCAIYE